GIAFFGMFLQLPLIALTQRLERMRSPRGRTLGNIVFWVSFTILGQPFAALMYYYAWQAKYGSVGRALRGDGTVVGTVGLGGVPQTCAVGN
ncbi:hypothetical protein C8A05DRAFT_17729, partial [Staphylotrichum tortipilum]